MKLTKLEGHENYTCTVIKLPAKQKVEGLDNLVRVNVFGNDCLIGKDSPEDELYLFFPAECQIQQRFLYENNLYRDSSQNINQDKKGFFELNGRVKSVKFKGVISTGFVIPITSFWDDFTKFRIGDEFNKIDDTVLCTKYKVERIQGLTRTPKESRFNNKLKRFDKLVPNQFRFHESTSHLAKNLHKFQANDIIVISDKWHGTSAVFSNVLVRKELNWKEKIAKRFGIQVADKVYDNLYSSRSVIKNQYINKEVTQGFYNEDIWGVVNKELKDKIEQGVTVYGEIVGYLQSGKEIQKGYDYGCETNEHKFLVYRITYTKPDGTTIEFSWQQIKDYCFKYQLEHVKELYFGIMDIFLGDCAGYEDFEAYQKHFLETLQTTYLEKDCKWCKNKVPAEGIIVRIDGKLTFEAYKLKSKRFLEHETKQLDKGEVNIEDDAAVSDM